MLQSNVAAFTWSDEVKSRISFLSVLMDRYSYRFFYTPKRRYPLWGTTQTRIHGITGRGSFLGIKLPKRQPDHSVSSSTDGTDARDEWRRKPVREWPPPLPPPPPRIDNRSPYKYWRSYSQINYQDSPARGTESILKGPTTDVSNLYPPRCGVRRGLTYATVRNCTSISPYTFTAFTRKNYAVA